MSVKNIVLALSVFVVLLSIVFPCPPWSLKSIVAKRAQCVSNLKQILKSLDDRKMPFDESHADGIRSAIKRLNLECSEGTDLRGRPATYSIQARNGAYMISEERGNHPARARLMAGRLAEEQFGIDALGKMTQVP